MPCSLLLVAIGLASFVGPTFAAPRGVKGEWVTTSVFVSATPTDKAAVSSAFATLSPSKGAAVPSVPVPAGRTSKPSGTLSLDSTFIYDLDNGPIGAPDFKSKSGVGIDASVYIFDLVRLEVDQIKAYKDAGKTAICYFSAGSLDPLRADAGNFDDACVCGTGGTLDSSNHCTGGDPNAKQKNWDQYWLDIHSPACKTNVRAAMTKRLQMAKEKGCDGIDPDNVDSYMNGAPHGNTEADQMEYLLWLSETTHAQGLLINLKNGAGLLRAGHAQELVSAFDFSVVESCHVYDECQVYEPFLAAGKPMIQIEYSNSITKCPALKPGQNLAVLSGLTLNSAQITLDCPAPRG